MRNVSHKSLKKIKTHILGLIILFFRKSCRLWDNVEKYGKAGQATDDNMILCMGFACRITKARIQKHSRDTLILISCLQQKSLKERASMLYSTYIACLVWPCTTQYNCVNLVARRWWRHSTSTNHCGPRCGVASSNQLCQSPDMPLLRILPSHSVTTDVIQFVMARLNDCLRKALMFGVVAAVYV
jgi:hypothetical protein